MTRGGSSMSALVNPWLLCCLVFLWAALLPSSAFFGLTAPEPLATLSWEVQDNVLAMDPNHQHPHHHHHHQQQQQQHHRQQQQQNHHHRQQHQHQQPQPQQQPQQPQSPSASPKSRVPRPPSPRQLCQLLKLPPRQARMCRRGRGVPQILIKATRLSVLECQHQFKYERWNCSLGHYRQKILQKGTKETSFLYAISSAGLVHEVSRACSQGTLDRCTCDQSNPAESKKTWMWGGCGDNINFGLRFTRRFLKKARKSGKDIRAQVDQHNSRVGIKVVKNEVNTTCKCHGVSGSCTVKTCWLQLAPFHSVGNILKRKYENAQKAFPHTNKATTRGIAQENNHRRANLSSLRRGQLAYMEESPNFCSRSRYSPGTQGRVCSKEGSCDSICCGRGYNVQHRRVKKACNCEVIWCCKVTCKVCWLQEEIYMCK